MKLKTLTAPFIDTIYMNYEVWYDMDFNEQFLIQYTDYV